MADSESSRLLKNGFFIAIGLVLLAGFILMIGSTNRLLSRKVAYVTHFPSASGLKQGDSVNYLGVQVGYVERFDIGTGKERVAVHYKVEEKIGRQFTTGNQAKIAMLGILGDKFIEIVPAEEGSEKPGTPLSPGAEIPASLNSFSIDTAGQGAQDLLSQLRDIAKKLDTTLATLNDGKGTIPRLFNDPKYGEKFLGDVQTSMNTLREVLDRVKAGKGTVGKLINDPVLGDRLVGNLDATARQLNAISSRIETGPGALHTVTADAKFNADMKELMHDLKETAASLHQQNSALGRLLNDPKYGAEITNHLSSAARHLDSIMTKIDNGEGSLGAIINDKSVYEDLKDLSAGLNKSGLAKRAIKHYEKKGHDRRQKSSSAPDAEPEPPVSAPAAAEGLTSKPVAFDAQPTGSGFDHPADEDHVVAAFDNGLRFAFKLRNATGEHRTFSEPERVIDARQFVDFGRRKVPAQSHLPDTQHIDGKMLG